MNYYFYGIIFLLISLTCGYPRPDPNDFDRFLENYFRERSEEMDDAMSNEELVVRRQNAFLQPLHFQQRQPQPICLPQSWTCGPSSAACCPGLTCYDGNAKRGRHCVARG